jgi:hypothetical protein
LGIHSSQWKIENRWDEVDRNWIENRSDEVDGNQTMPEL